MPPRRLTLLHAIHDFLPRHQAGSEIYACALARALQARHDVTVLAAEFDGARGHGQVTWRVHDGLPVVELVNNWVCRSFEDTYRAPRIADRIAHVLDTIRPDVVHVHSLLNLSFALPEAARARGMPVVATLHDYTLVCPSGGQRVHRADRHLCTEIDPGRCARCFGESPSAAQMSVGRMMSAAPGLNPLPRLASAVRRRLPVMAGRAASVARRATAPAVTADQVATRLRAAAEVLDRFDRVVAPSALIADEFVRFGLDAAKVVVSDYGVLPMARAARRPFDGRLRIGYVGSLVWHKGLHVLIDAVRQLDRSRCVVRLHGDRGVAPDYVRSIRAQAAGLPVEFAGGFDRRRVADVYAGLDVLVVPSIWLENSPLVIHEAFMAGVPVVGARIGGIPGLVRDGVSGLLYDPSSPDDLARVLRRLIDEPTLVADLARGVPMVKTIDDDAQEWERRYLEVMAAQGTA